MSSSNSPCAACKFLRRKCTQECVFAPYFPADQPQRFANVHKVFGASNVAKILNELESRQREDAVNSLAYEAEARLRDPVYGCVGVISFLQQTLKQLHVNLDLAKKELASMVGPAAMMQMLHSPNSYLAASPAAAMMPYNINMMVPGPGPLDPHPQQHQLMMRDAQAQVLRVQEQQQQHNQAIDAQQLAAMQVREEQEIMRSFEQQLRYEAGDGRGGEPRQQPLLALGTGFGGNPYLTQQQQQPQQSDSEAVHRTMALQFHEQGAAGSANEDSRTTAGQPC